MMPAAAAAAAEQDLPQHQHQQQQQSTKQAAAKAVAFWLALYIAWAHCLVVWKWMTPSPLGNLNHASHNHTLIIIAPTGVEDHEISSIHATLPSEMKEQLQELLDQLDVALVEARASAAEGQDQVSALELWTREVEQLAEFPPPPKKATTASSHRHEFLKVRNLLKIADLSELRSNAQADKYFSLAINELEKLVVADTQDGDVDSKDDAWHAVALYLATSEFPERTPVTRTSSNNSSSVCSSVGTRNDHDNNNSNNNQTYNGPTRADLDEAEALLQQIFLSQKDSSGGLPVSFAATAERLRQALLLRAAQQTVITAESATTTSMTPVETTDCLNSPRDVLPWLQAGLEALYRKQDMRLALLQALQEDGIDTSRILLDANLDDDDDQQDLAQQQQTPPVTLRQLLDQPTLHEWSVWVDRFLDWISGRHDGLDDILDKYLSIAPVSDADDRPVGRALVALLLRQAGRVKIPPAVWPKRQ